MSASHPSTCKDRAVRADAGCWQGGSGLHFKPQAGGGAIMGGAYVALNRLPTSYWCHPSIRGGPDVPGSELPPFGPPASSRQRPICHPSHIRSRTSPWRRQRAQGRAPVDGWTCARARTGFQEQRASKGQIILLNKLYCSPWRPAGWGTEKPVALPRGERCGAVTTTSAQRYKLF